MFNKSDPPSQVTSNRRPIDAQPSTQAPNTRASRVRNDRNSGVNPGSIAAIAVGTVAVLGVGGYAGYVGLQNAAEAAKVEQAVNKRLADDGVAKMTDSEIETYLDKATPLLDRTGSLESLQWEDIIKNRGGNFTPGVYLTKTQVIYKETMGSTPTPGSVPLIGHKIGIVSPEQAEKRLTKWLAAQQSFRR